MNEYINIYRRILFVPKKSETRGSEKVFSWQALGHVQQLLWPNLRTIINLDNKISINSSKNSPKGFYIDEKMNNFIR